MEKEEVIRAKLLNIFEEYFGSMGAAMLMEILKTAGVERIVSLDDKERALLGEDILVKVFLRVVSGNRYGVMRSRIYSALGIPSANNEAMVGF